jgi:spore coat polysaccharide biosynthesis protein SpsF
VWNASRDKPVVAVIQARMTSGRLPGKSLAPLGGRTILDLLVHRCQRAQLVDQVVIATSVEGTDDPIDHAATGLGVRCIRGSLTDVLDRYRQACLATRARTVVRLTADCPFAAPELIDAAVSTLASTGADYASTSLDGRYPRGLDVEAVGRSALLAAAAEATDPLEREHVTLFVYRNSTRFKCRAVTAPAWAAHPELRITVDEEADLRLVRAVVEQLGGNPDIPARSIMQFLLDNPDVASINAGVQHRNVT